MPDDENWAAYGFPDDLIFRPPYLPWAGLIKAMNERREAVDLEPFPVPEYFSSFGGMIWESDFGWALSNAVVRFVNPDKVSSAEHYRDCLWDPADLENAALDGEELENVNSPLRPLYSAKWAIWTYNKINILRYVPTSEPEDWPTFHYADRYSTFKFK